MPAYRSSAEGEIREAVVARLRAIRPGARIIHEINTSSYGNRIDVLAVDRAEIIAVEIKSAKDKLDRLKDQLAAMRGVAHHSIAALHQKFYVEQATNQWASEYERDGKHYLLASPLDWNTVAWRYPEHAKQPWREPGAAIQATLPSAALDMLWREELLEMCFRYSVCVPKRPGMGVMVTALRWSLTGRDLALGICAALRARRCVEADPEIEWREEARPDAPAPSRHGREG